MVTGLALITVEDARVFGVLNPAQREEPSLWWSWPRVGVTARPGGPAMRPRTHDAVSLTHRGSVVDLLTIHRLNPRSKRCLEAQERSLLEVLGAKELTR